MEALFEQGFSRPWRLMNAGDYHAGFPVDIWETNDALELDAAIPGVAPEDVTISLTAEALTISCERRGAETDGDRRYAVREIGQGKYQRTVGFQTPIDPDKTESRYENGILHLRMPKAASAQVRQIRLGDTQKQLGQ
jgi:HSP20 family protein